MIITHATVFDINGITDCAARFFEYAKFDYPLDRGDFKRLILGYIEDPKGLVLLLKDKEYGKVVGGIAGMIVPWCFNNKIKIMSELFYWVDEEFRGRKSIELLNRFEKESEELGAAKITMVAVATHLAECVGKLYERRGFKLVEQWYEKKLGKDHNAAA